MPADASRQERFRGDHASIHRVNLWPFHIMFFAQEPAYRAHFQLVALSDKGFEYVEWVRGPFQSCRDSGRLIQQHRMSEANV